jgi:hypothetical protein
MLSLDLDLFVRLPDEGPARVLHPAKVTGINDTLFSLECEEEGITLGEKSEILIYYNREREFVQQSARVKTISSLEPRCIVAIELHGEAVSAESRECYRVSTVLSSLSATFGPEENCQLNDVSITGFSVTAAHNYEIGAHVSTILQYEGKSFSGTACVQSKRKLGEDRIRYGLHCVNDENEGGFELQRSLRQIGAAVQRQQMRRLAGES